MERSVSPEQIFQLSDSESIKANSKALLSQKKVRMHAFGIQGGVGRKSQRPERMPSCCGNVTHNLDVVQLPCNNLLPEES